ncbi:MAG: 16S rRNA (uracil(1498)-N(3))-methyltransferase [Myxococcales bacterium]|nr:MAG: 16S rRNA (uracil(1498)-N(3))-methyltransferase [Myxococcales bacterium]
MTDPKGGARILPTPPGSPLPKARFFVEPEKLSSDRAILAGSSYHHLKNVLRLRPGAELVVFDGAGRESIGVLETFQGENAIIRILGDTERATESSLELTVVLCLAKGKKTDLCIEKSVELGVDRICVVTSERSVGRLGEASAIDRVERWRRVAIAAAEQARRTEIPVVERVQRLDAFIEMGKPEDTLGLVFTVGADPDPPATLRQRYPSTRKVIAIIGPEGGLTREEIEVAGRHGYKSVGLGPRVLRTETAAIVAVAICQHLWGDLGRKPPNLPVKD